MGWIRIRMDPTLLPGSGTRKIQSWIRIQNKSFRIHNTGNKTFLQLLNCYKKTSSFDRRAPYFDAIRS